MIDIIIIFFIIKKRIFFNLHSERKIF
jgi:hypothetical protein